MEELGLQRHALVPLNEVAWNYQKQQGVVTPEIYKNLIDRMEDKDNWARQMLRSNKGLEKLASLLSSPDKKTEDKGLKILATYEDISEELKDRLKSLD